MNVIRSKYFGELFKNLPKDDKVKIAEFILHIKTQGFSNLKGRNKPSDNVPTDDPNWLYKVKYAQTYNLWHYHIGIPSYPKNCIRDCTSEYVIHYILADSYIMLVDFSAHPPFKLPKTSALLS